MNLAQRSFACVVGLCALTPSVAAQQLGYWFDYPGTPYSVTDLGAVAGVNSPYGAILFKPGDSNTLLIAGDADDISSTIMQVPVVRDGAGHITGFGAPTPFAAAPGLVDGGLDGALVRGPSANLFYTTFPDNTLGQIKPGSAGPDKLIDLTAIGVTPSTGGVVFTPSWIPNAGQIRVASWTAGTWYHGALSPDGAGTYDLSVGAPVTTIGGGVESMIYLPSSTTDFYGIFTGLPAEHGWLLVSKYIGGRVDAYEIDAQGDPMPASEIPFIDDVDCAVGMAVDPQTGDLFISIFFCTDRIIRVSGFPAPCPADLNADGQVSGADISYVLANWGTAGPVADLTGDGTVNGTDITVVLSAWGPCP